MAEAKEIVQLAKLIDAVARRCWRGLPALMGQAPEPTREQMKEAVFYKPKKDIERVHGGTIEQENGDVKREIFFIDNIDPLLKAVPWPDLVLTVKWFIKARPQDWNMYITLLCNTETARARWGSRSAAETLAERYGVSVQNVYDVSRGVPRAIARAASIGIEQLEDISA